MDRWPAVPHANRYWTEGAGALDSEGVLSGVHPVKGECPPYQGEFFHEAGAGFRNLPTPTMALCQ